MDRDRCGVVTVWLQFCDKRGHRRNGGRLRSDRHADVFHPEVILHAVMAAFAAQTGLLDAGDDGGLKEGAVQIMPQTAGQNDGAFLGGIGDMFLHFGHGLITDQRAGLVTAKVPLVPSIHWPPI